MTRNALAHRRLAAVALTALLVAAGLAGCSGKKAEPTAAPPTPARSEAPNPALGPAVTSPLPGEPAPVKKPPELPGAIGVMIDNHPNARPHAGLDLADLVYETEAEGGITRFLALFYQNKAEKVGPVRSARMGFYDIATAYGIPYAHAGGNNDVLVELKNNNRRLLNMDDINGGGGAFWREKDREMPHNLYTSTDRIVNHAKAVGFKLVPLPSLPEGPLPDGGKAVSRIALNWGPKAEHVVWQWNGKRYERSQSDTLHQTESGAIIAADNLVVLFTRFDWDQAAQWGEGQNNIRIVGKGSGYFYRGGKAFAIQWEKNSREAHYRFTLADGSELRYAPGQTWVEILKDEAHLSVVD